MNWSRIMRSRLITWSAAVLLLLILALLVVPHFISLDGVAHDLARSLSNATGLKVTIGHGHIAIFPDLSFVASDIRIAHASDAIETFEIESVRVDLDFFSLICGRVLVEEAHVYSPLIRIIRDSAKVSGVEHEKNDEALNPFELLAVKNPFGFLDTVDELPNSLSIFISDGQMVFYDAAADDSRVRVTTLSDLEVSVMGMNSYRPFEVEMSYKLGKEGRAGEARGSFNIAPSCGDMQSAESGISLTGELIATDVLIASLRPCLSPELREAGVHGSLDLRLKLAKVCHEQATAHGEINVSDLWLSKSLNQLRPPQGHHAEISFSADLNSERMSLRQLVVKLDDSVAKGEADISNWLSDRAEVQGSISLRSIPVKTILDLIPAPLLPTDTSDEFKAMDISGELCDLSAELRGKVSDLSSSASLFPAQLSASCRLTGGAVSPAFKGISANTVESLVSIRNGVVCFENIRGNAGVLVDGVLKAPIPLEGECGIGFMKDVEMLPVDISSVMRTSSNLNKRALDAVVVVGARATSSLLSFQRVSDAIPSLSSVSGAMMELGRAEGNIRAGVKVLSFLARPYRAEFLATFGLSDGGLRHDASGFQLRGASAEVKLSNDALVADLKAQLDDQSSVIADLHMDAPFDETPTWETNGRVELALPHLLARLGAIDAEELTMSGIPTLVVRLGSSPEGIKLALSTDMKELDIRFGDILWKPTNEKCNFSLSGVIKEFEKIIISDSRLDMGGISIQLTGDITSPSQPRCNLSAYLRETKVQNATAFFPPFADLESDGEISGWARLMSPARQSEQSAGRGDSMAEHLFEAGIALEIDAQTVDRLLGAEVMPLALQQASLKLDVLSGKISTLMSARFPLSEPESLQYEVGADVQDLTAKYKDFPLPLTGLSGRIEMANETLRLLSLKGLLGGSEFEVSGQFKEPLKALLNDRGWDKNELELKIACKPSLLDIRTLLGSLLPEDVAISKRAALEIQARGSLTDLKFNSRLDLGGSRLSWGDVICKPEGKALRLSLAGHLAELRRVLMEEGLLTIGSSNFSFTADIADLKNPGVELQLADGALKTSDLTFLFSMLEPGKSKGELGVKLAGMLGGDNSEQHNFHATLTARDVGFQLAGAIEAISDLNLLVEASSDTISVKKMNFSAGKSTLSIDGEARLKDSALRLDVESPRLDIADIAAALWPASPRESNRPGASAATVTTSDLTWLWSTPLLADGRIQAATRIDDLRFDGHEFGKLNLDLPIDRGALSVKDLTLALCQGNLRISLLTDISAACGFDIRTDFTLDDYDVKEMLDLLGAKRTFMTGKGNISGRIQACGNDSDGLLRSADGQFRIRMRDGIIKKFGLLSKIFSLLDILRVFKLDFRDFATTGTAYSLMRCTATLKDGQLHTDDLFLDGSSMKVTGMCDIDLVNMKIDGSIGVFLLPTMGIIASKIPLMGRIITHENETLIASYFRVNGDLADPNVQSVGVEKVKEGTKSLFRRLLTVEPQDNE
ncbi:AsmA-like C-terminal domain-containing protein [bacterium]|nr:AsmA-like C-terminal domain-containing protein [bacterium]